MLCIPTASVPGTIQEKLAEIAAAGFSAIELRASDVGEFDGDLCEIADLVASNGLRLHVLGPVEYPQSLEIAQDVISMAETLGAAILMIDVRADFPEEFPFPGPQKDLKIALRPTRDFESEVLMLIEKIDHPRVGLALNSSFALGDGSRPARLRDLPGDRVFHVQLTDGPRATLLPGQGTLNLPGFIRVLKRCGFRGGWCVAGEPQAQDSAKSGFRSLVNVLDEVARSNATTMIDIPQLPPRVPATGIEFIEFAVDEESEAQLEQHLLAMSFRRERRHVSKDVTLWRQGAVNIVVNRDPNGHARLAFEKHGPTVCDMGLRVLDAKKTAERATALGTSPYLQAVELGELSIPAIRGVGSSLVHFIDEKSDLHRVWDIEFELVGAANPPQPVGIRRIDHVAQTMKYDEMQKWLLYYISTFEMEKSPIVNVSDPAGIVRSQAIESPEGEVRLNLNGAVGHQTFAGSFVSGNLCAGVQHLAFLSDDIFETASRLARNGFDRLNISPDYFRETRDHFGLSDDLVADLRTFDILYDRDEAGEFFQLYSRPLFGGFFFEIVQRRGSYRGYGARNAPVRLAAQTSFKTTEKEPLA